MTVRLIALIDGAHREITLTPKKAIKYKCLDCAGSWPAVQKCEFIDCSLYPYRLKRNVPLKKGIRLFQMQTLPAERLVWQSSLTPIKAIRSFCRDYCSCEQPLEVRLCTNPDCTLYPYRMGKRPTNFEPIEPITRRYKND